MKALVIIPAYNESNHILKVVQQVKEADSSIQIDYLVVNDCSTDSTEKVLLDNHVVHISLPVNLGIGGAVQAGYLFAKDNNYDFAIQLDGDGQHDAAYINDLLVPIINDEADFVIGSRFIEKQGFQSSATRRIGIKVLSILIQLVCRTKVLDVTSGFRAVNRRGIMLFSAEYAQDYPEPEAIICGIKNDLKIKEVPVVMNDRISGESSINGLKSMYYMIKVSLAILLAGIQY